MLRQPNCELARGIAVTLQRADLAVLSEFLLLYKLSHILNAYLLITTSIFKADSLPFF